MLGATQEAKRTPARMMRPAWLFEKGPRSGGQGIFGFWWLGFGIEPVRIEGKWKVTSLTSTKPPSHQFFVREADGTQVVGNQGTKYLEVK